MSPLSASDFRALQGTWEQTALEDNGVLNPVDAHSAPGAITTIAGEGMPRPTVFSTGPGQTMRTFVRRS